MWIIDDRQMEGIFSSIREEKILRICAFVRRDPEYADALPEFLFREVNESLDLCRKKSITEEEWIAEFIRLKLRYPGYLTPPLCWNVSMILDSKAEPDEKLDKLSIFLSTNKG